VVHVRVAGLPLVTVLGLAVRVTVGVGVLTATVADWEALPPGPVQLRLKVDEAVSAPVEAVPLVALAPLQAPLAAQALALLDDHVRVALPPELTVLGPTLSVTVGAAADTVTVADCVAVPAGPVQLRV
jgi:hypothetical protein